MYSFQPLGHLRRHHGSFCQPFAGEGFVGEAQPVHSGLELYGVNPGHLSLAYGIYLRLHSEFLLDQDPEALGGAAGCIQLMYVMGFLTPKEKFWERVWDPCCDDIRLRLVDYVSGLWGISKSDVLRLIKGGGLKVNNQVPDKDVCVRNLPWIRFSKDWKFCVIKKGKNVFDFILCACCGSVFELTDDEIVKEMADLEYDIAMESGWNMACQMQGNYKCLEEESKRRNINE